MNRKWQLQFEMDFAMISHVATISKTPKLGHVGCTLPHTSWTKINEELGAI